MNERILELAVQAGIEFTYDPTEVPMRVFIEAWEGDLEKFAELIVRKCIKDCRDMFVVDSVSWNLLNEKLEHFGVEE